ncbi:MmcQ/YjbR family DNA-binding protein [Mycolicibacterium sp.]|uniref:MmcQ/YjbR family DNA-binding protein n=1 Tax=Mycolicibacterium sp. TaxID=2320850 RepID=UPI001A1B64B2|nr:MmcQ/YjbR family DNA-binding protein [Mycolicibacterium sp.]MBJ7336270.1 MmcQ/YjbR family DNA-binding protein [Mycolicibacterium sp.]
MIRSVPHPVMFGHDDPGLAELRSIALALPDAYEKVSHGRPGFFATKMFASYGGSSKVTRPPGHVAAEGEMVRYPYSMLVKVDDAERAALAQDARFYYPAYIGASGWLGLDFTAAEVDWDEVRELVDASFRLVASAKLIAELDGR